MASSWLNGEYDYKRMGNTHPLISPYTVFKTSDDQWMVIGVATDLQFEKFSKVLGLDELPRDPKFIHNKERVDNFKELYEILKEKIESRKMDDLSTVFKEAGVPFSPINSIKQLFEQPEVQSMNLTDKVTAPQYGTKDLEFPRFPIRFDYL